MVIRIVVIESVKLQRPARRTKTVWGKVKRKGGKEEEEEKRGTRRRVRIRVYIKWLRGREGNGRVGSLLVSFTPDSMERVKERERH